MAVHKEVWPSKQCRTCSHVKDAIEFYKNSELLSGLSSSCKSCVSKRKAEWVKANPDRHKASVISYQEKNREKCLIRAQQWAENNRERSRQIKAEWKKRNPETVRRHAREAARRDPEKQAARKRAYLAANPEVGLEYQRKRRAENCNRRVNDAMGNRMRDVLRSNKGGKSWIALVGYGLDDLVAHLEAKFLPGMTWENYGQWHIDHVRPVSSYDFEEDMESKVRECWGLKNLQPLWALDNMTKGKKWDGERCSSMA